MKKLDDDECWHYSESNYSLGKKGSRHELTYVGRAMSKTKFKQIIETWDKSESFGTWVWVRITHSGNQTDLSLAKKNEGKVVVYFDDYDGKKTVVKIVSILTGKNELKHQ